MTGESPLDRFRRWYRLLPPAMRFLLTVNTVLYVAWWVFRFIEPAARFITTYLVLHPEPPVPLFRPWQLVTYSVIDLQVGLWGLIGFAFNMLWLNWMGREYEETYGSHRLFGLYVLAALGGALFAVLMAAMLPGTGGIVTGALPAVLGVICAVATLYPDRGIGLFILGVVPLKWLAAGFLVLLALFSIGHPALLACYLGAAATGVLFARMQQRGTDLAAWAQAFFPPRGAYGGYGAARRTERAGMLERVEQWLARRQGEEAPRRKASVQKTTSGRSKSRRSTPVESVAVEPSEVDRILDKISEQGYDALTDEEKRVLYEASKR